MPRTSKSSSNLCSYTYKDLFAFFVNLFIGFFIEVFELFARSMLSLLDKNLSLYVKGLIFFLKSIYLSDTFFSTFLIFSF